MEKLNLRATAKLAMILPSHRHRCMGGGFGLSVWKHLPHSWYCYRPTCEDPRHLTCGLFADAVICQKQGLATRNQKQDL